MFIIGLTGSSGSGKGYVDSVFEKNNIRCTDTDKIVHKLYEGKNECTEEIRHSFGDCVIFPDGSVNRKRLGEIVFRERSALERLNHIVHRYVAAVVSDLIDQCRKNNEKAFVIDAPMLFESGLDRVCDIKLAVVADEKTKIERIMKRDRISAESAILRLENQYSDEFFVSNCDFVIHNNTGDDVEKQINDFIRIYLHI